jgi:hypothetical protein
MKTKILAESLLKGVITGFALGIGYSFSKSLMDKKTIKTGKSQAIGGSMLSKRGACYENGQYVDCSTVERKRFNKWWE